MLGGLLYDVPPKYLLGFQLRLRLTLPFKWLGGFYLQAGLVRVGDCGIQIEGWAGQTQFGQS
jgi:hypothetical protein